MHTYLSFRLGAKIKNTTFFYLIRLLNIIAFQLLKALFLCISPFLQEGNKPTLPLTPDIIASIPDKSSPLLNFLIYQIL